MGMLSGNERDNPLQNRGCPTESDPCYQPWEAPSSAALLKLPLTSSSGAFVKLGLGLRGQPQVSRGKIPRSCQESR